MGNIFDNSIPKQDLNNFMRNFSHNGKKREDLDRRDNFGEGKFTRGYIGVPDKIKKASSSKNLDTERFDKYRSSRSSKDGWFDTYKSDLKKTFNGLYHENFSRDEDAQENEFTKDTDILRLNTHRPDNIHYNVKPISRNELSCNTGEVADDKLGELVKDFDSKIDRTKPSDIYTKVDEAIKLAEKLEASKASKADQVENLQTLISVFDLMDKLIQGDISNLEGVRDGDKRNRGKDTGKQTSAEKSAVDGLMTRTTEKAELKAKRAELNQKLVLKQIFKIYYN